VSRSNALAEQLDTNLPSRKMLNFKDKLNFVIAKKQEVASPPPPVQVVKVTYFYQSFKLLGFAASSTSSTPALNLDLH